MIDLFLSKVRLVYPTKLFGNSPVSVFSDPYAFLRRDGSFERSWRGYQLLVSQT